MPASVAYAIFRQDLFEADLAVRRLFAELLLTGVATALYATALALAYRFWPDAAASPAVAVALAATLLFFAVPIRDRVKSNVDAWLEGRRYDAQQALASLAQALSAELSLERALARLEDTLQHTIGPANASVQLEDEGAAPTVTTIHGAAMPAVQSEVLRDSALVLRRSIFTAGTGKMKSPPTEKCACVNCRRVWKWPSHCVPVAASWAHCCWVHPAVAPRGIPRRTCCLPVR